MYIMMICVWFNAGYIQRVIVHPAFLNASFSEVEKELAKMDLGEAIFRPSSKVSTQTVIVLGQKQEAYDPVENSLIPRPIQSWGEALNQLGNEAI